MVKLVTLQQASDHLRRDTTDDDADLSVKVMAASRAVLNYIDDHSFLNSTGEPDYDSAGDPVGVPDPIHAAVLLVTADLYTDRDQENFRDGGTAPRVGEIIFSRTVHFLLDPYRIPTVK